MLWGVSQLWREWRCQSGTKWDMLEVWSYPQIRRKREISPQSGIFVGWFGRRRDILGACDLLLRFRPNSSPSRSPSQTPTSLGCRVRASARLISARHTGVCARRTPRIRPTFSRGVSNTRRDLRAGSSLMTRPRSHCSELHYPRGSIRMQSTLQRIGPDASRGSRALRGTASNAVSQIGWSIRKGSVPSRPFAPCVRSDTRGH